MKKSRLVGVLCTLTVLFATNIFAADKYWVCDSGSWDDDSCWNPANQPLDGDNVYLTQTGSIDTTVTYASAISPVPDFQEVIVDSSGAGTMTLSLSQDSLSAYDLTIGLDGVGIFTQYGGVVNPQYATNFITLGAKAGANGTYNLYNGLVTNQFLLVGASTNGLHNSGTGTFNMYGGDAHLDIVTLGDGSTGNGTFNMDGGYFNASEISIDNNSSFNQSGGDVYLSNAISLSTSGTYNLTGGTLAGGSHQYGSGTINNSGGIHTGGLRLLESITYNLSGTGSVANAEEVVGGGVGAYSSTDIAILNQSGGTNTTSNLYVGGSSGWGSGNGTYNLSGGSLSAQNEAIGYDSIGTFNQTGGTNTVDGTMTIAELDGSNGTYNLSGGRLEANSIVVNSGGSFNFDGGTLLVDDFTGDLINNGGTLEPGASPGITNIFGNYTQSIFGTYIAEIAGLTQGSEHDLLNITGTAMLGGLLDVNLLNTDRYTPSLGDTFDILMADTITGEFDILLLASLSGNLDWDISYILDPYSTDIVRLSVVQAVPIPAAIWLFGTGLLGLIGIARKKVA
jgi:hypothetical protein